MRPIDYTKFGPNGETANQVLNRRWWLVSKAERSAAVFGVVKMLGEYDSKRQTQYQISCRLYGNTNLMGLNGLSYGKIAAVQNAMKDRITYNIAQSTVDTITAKMVKNKPKALFLTSGGDYKIQRKAKKLDKFVEGVFYENDAYKLGGEIFRDGCVFGDGVVHVYDHYGRVRFERVLASEMYTDWMEAFYGKPRQLHRVKSVDREVLVDLFPDHRDLILSANASTADQLGSYQNVSDQVTITESWHLASGPEATDGLHTINIAEGNLFEEEWKKDGFPFAMLPWCKRMYGNWSQGLVEQIQNIQVEVNKLLWVIQRSMHLSGTFKVLLAAGSKVVKEHINNDIGTIVNYTGTEPKYVIPPIVPMEIYQHLRDLKTAAYEQAGISQLSASSQKPAGLNSGKALREYNDIESDRFMTTGQAYERFFLDLAKLAVSTAKEIYDREGSYEVKVPGKKFIQTIDWGDIDLADDQYVMKIFPVSSLPNDPAGRLQTIQEYVQAGFISPRTARQLLEFPDLEQVENLQNSAEEYLHMILEKVIDEGEYTQPEPYDDLALARELGLEYYSQGKTNGMEEEKLDLLRKFIDDVNFLQAKATQPAPGAQPAPQAVPEAPPQSNMIPNVPQIGAA